MATKIRETFQAKFRNACTEMNEEKINKLQKELVKSKNFLDLFVDAHKQYSSEDNVKIIWFPIKITNNKGNGF